MKINGSALISSAIACALWTTVDANLLAADQTVQLAQAADPFGPVEVREGVREVAVPDVDVTVEKPKDKDAETAEEPEDTEEASPEKPALDPKFIQLNLMDGSVISGNLSVDQITVTTSFGELNIPIESIKSFKPGLDSYPTLEKEVEALIESLGSDDYTERENARKALAKMGPPIRAELKRHAADENAERARHVKAILEEFQKMTDSDDPEAASATPWIRQDTVETTDFTVTGQITPKSFGITSKYGVLNIDLADVRRGIRDFGEKEDLRKSLSVEGQYIAQRSFKNSGVRVTKGDKISITADGQIVMTPWGSDSVSTPDGAQNFGWYTQNEIPGGALVAKIGDTGTVLKVGSKNSWTADRSGTLQFAVAIQHQYARGNYHFPGQYNVKVRVESE